MRRRRGSIGMIGLIALGVIFLFALMFVPEVFGHMHEASNVTGTIYEAPYSAVENVTYTMTTAGIPVMTIFIFIIGFFVAFGVFLWIFK